MKTKKVGVPTSLLEVEVFKAFTATGETTGLLILADACEAGEADVGEPRLHFARLLRGVANTVNPAVHWFYLHGHKSHYFTTESERQGHLRCAAKAAWFEARAFEKLNSGQWRFHWDEDLDSNDEGPDEHIWSCGLFEIVPATGPNTFPGWRHVNSLGGIDLGHDGQPPREMTANREVYPGAEPAPYCRVVMAQIAEEAIMEAGKADAQLVPPWLALEVPPVSEIGILRWADGGGYTGWEHHFHPIVQNKLVLILPCVPPEELLNDDGVEAKHACRAYFVHEGKLEETFFTHAEFMRNSTRWNPALDKYPWEVMSRLLTEKNMAVALREWAPPNYRKTHEARRTQMRRDQIPF